jgi:hypothetical protein
LRIIMNSAPKGQVEASSLSENAWSSVSSDNRTLTSV